MIIIITTYDAASEYFFMRSRRSRKLLVVETGFLRVLLTILLSLPL
jgi:hypothetical protein